MSIAMESSRIGGGFMSGKCNNMSILDPKKWVVVEDRENKKSSVLVDPCSSSSSSIGNNSDDDDDHDDGEEVESQLKDDKNNNNTKINTCFDSAVNALEQALPIRRGISKFYNGKSKSYASLADAACSSIKEITKPENAYTRKRKNLLAYSILYDKGRSSMLKGPGIGGGISKRSINPSRSTLALAVAMGCDSPIDENGPNPEMDQTSSLSPPQLPVPPPPWRSFSLADLQHCAVAVNSNLSSSLMGKRTNPDEVS